jgi:hypothetical protein
MQNEARCDNRINLVLLKVDFIWQTSNTFKIIIQMCLFNSQL